MVFPELLRCILPAHSLKDWENRQSMIMQRVDRPSTYSFAHLEIVRSASMSTTLDTTVLTRVFGLEIGHIVHILIDNDPQVVRLLVSGNIASRKGLRHDHNRYENSQGCCNESCGACKEGELEDVGEQTARKWIFEGTPRAFTCEKLVPPQNTESQSPDPHCWRPDCNFLLLTRDSPGCRWFHGRSSDMIPPLHLPPLERLSPGPRLSGKLRLAPPCPAVGFCAKNK